MHRRLATAAALGFAWLVLIPATLRAASPCTPVLQWTWDGDDMAPDSPNTCSTPMVLQLTDDDGDGRIGPGDTPDVVLVHGVAAHNFGEIVALDGATGATHFNIDSPRVRVDSVAAGDIDGDGIVEILAVDAVTSELLAFENDGSLKWRGAVPGPPLDDHDPMAIADMDQDGSPEIAVGWTLFDASGAMRCEGSPTTNWYFFGRNVALADMDDASPGLELYSGGSIYDADCRVLHRAAWLEDHRAVLGDLDGDGRPEIVTGTAGMLYVLAGDLSVLDFINFSALSIAPTLADFDGDGMGEVFVTNGSNAVVLDWDIAAGQLVPLWPALTVQDWSGSTSASAFDFDADGADDIVYLDEEQWYIIDGPTGAILSQIPFPSSTGLEMPVIADVDGDGVTEILVATCRSHWSLPVAETNQLRVYECAGSALARSMWNQHGYHVTNICDDGTIPQFEQPIWQIHDAWAGQLGAGPACEMPLACDAGADISAGCDGVRLAGTASGSGGGALIVAWSSSCPATTFDPSADVLDPVVRFGSSDDVDCTLTLLVTDSGGETCSDDVRVRVDDRTPPSVVPWIGDLACAWPPNHRYLCFAPSDLPISATDDCPGPVSLRFAACLSNQPDDAPRGGDPNGDGSTTDDCVVSADGLQACVRVERAGRGREARRYALHVVATDASGNESAPVLVGHVRVGHDRRDGATGCERVIGREGRAPRGRLVARR